MEEIFGKIQSKIVEFNTNLHQNVFDGNKSAGVRARKASLELEKMFKEYRKVSLEMVKK